MKTRIFLLTLCFLLAKNSFAQKDGLNTELEPGQEYTNRINYIFQYVDTSKITTGLLIDYGLQMIAPEYFDGVPADSNYVDMDTWKMLYLGIYSSKINNNANLVLPDTIFNRIDNASYTNAVPVAMMHFQYNQFRENAVSLGILNIINDQIIEVQNPNLDNIKNTPYITKQLFAVAPKELYFDSPIVSFVFMQNLWYTNVNKIVQKHEINFNNESGYITALRYNPVIYTFSSAGVKTIYFRLTYTDGTSYTSQTNIVVRNVAEYIPLVSTLSSVYSYDSVMLPATSQHSGGKIQIKYSSYNYTGTIRKPLIVAEGFDPSCIMRSEENIDINDFLSSLNASGTINISYLGYRNLYNDIDYDKYDIIYLDYNNGVDDIWRNAQLFREVIEWVNANKVGVNTNVVMGISMGGLVARIALRKMEIDGVNHQTWKYISVDSPHKGANVPLGFQAAVRHIQNTNLQIFFSTFLCYMFFDDTRNAVNLLNSTAVKQMLIYTINSGYSFDNSMHNAFQSQYDQLGFPEQCMNIATSNGSNFGTLLFPAGSSLICNHERHSFKWWMEIIASIISPAFIVTNFPQLVLNVIPGKSELRVDVDVFALKNKSASEIYNTKIYIYKKVLWLIPVNINITSKKVNSTASMLPIDGAPGGKYDINAIGELPFDDDAIKQKYICFIPTVSSLALQDWETKLTQRVNTSPAFNDVYTQSSNELHTRFNSSALFLYNHLINIPDLAIYGEDDIYSVQQAKYTIYGLPIGTNVTWSVSNNMKIISGQGTSQVTISICDAGQNKLTATLSGTVNKTLTKTLRANHGKLTLNGSHNKIIASFQHPYAQCYDWMIYGFDSEIGNGDINCSNRSLLLLDVPDDSYGGCVTVRASDGNGCYSMWDDGCPDVWRPVIDVENSDLNPIICVNSLTPCTIRVKEPIYMDGFASYYWYFDNVFFEVTSRPYLYWYFSALGSHKISVSVDGGDGIASIRGEANYYGQRGSGYYSAAYPNPASDELIIDKIEENNTENQINTQTAKINQSEITVLLYSNSTTKLVYSKNYSSSEKQIKIDTSKLPNGVYYLNIIENGETVKQQTIIVNH
jgi:hypothetical protein